MLSGLSKKKTKSLLIHLTGTGCIADEREQTWEGKLDPQVWNDITEIEEIYNLPDVAQHRITDKWIQDATNDLVKTVCICPPDIFGQSSTLGNRATYLVPDFVEACIPLKETFYLGLGENIRAVTHINDVCDLFALVLQKWLDGGHELSYGKEVSDPNLNSRHSLLLTVLLPQGFYFAVSGGVAWKEAAEAISKIGQEQGWLPKGSQAKSYNQKQCMSIKEDDVEGAPESGPMRALYLWGSNSRADSARAKKLGWEPHGPSFWEALPEDCKVAAAKLVKI
jgi:nucleoside-diphosphate-sugar epimerase